MVSSLLSRLGLPVLMAVVSSALSVINHPSAHAAAQALRHVEEAVKSGGISADQLREANRHTETMAQIDGEAEQHVLAEINASLRAEIVSQDAYVRRMRPTFGYLMAFTWAAQMFGVAYVMVFETEKAGVVMTAMSHLSAIWAVGLSVLGIYVYKRSEDKKLWPRQDVIFWDSSPED